MTSDDPERSKMPNRKWFDLSRSPEVNKFGTVRKTVYDFLLVNNSNFVAISHRLYEIWAVKVQKFIRPLGELWGSQLFQKVASGSRWRYHSVVRVSKIDWWHRRWPPVTLKGQERQTGSIGGMKSCLVEDVTELETDYIYNFIRQQNNKIQKKWNKNITK